MLNYNEEIKKFKPMLEIEDIDKSSKNDGTADMLELLQYIAKKVDAKDRFENDKE